MLDEHRHTSWIEIDLDKIRYNYRQLRKAAAPAQILAVVKAQAYGHGLEAVALTLDEEDVWGFCVASVSEGRRLRQIGIKRPIIIIAPILPSQIEDAIKFDLRPPILDLDFAKKVSAKAQELETVAKVHLKVDTGMGRLSSPIEQIIEKVQDLADLPNLEYEGIYSHFAAADQLDQSYSQLQMARFVQCIEAVAEKLKITYKHISASSGTILLEKAKFDLTRVGISLYGLWPSEQVRLIVAGRDENIYKLSSDQVNGNKELDKFGSGRYQQNPSTDFIRPALTFKTVISQVKTLLTGESVGYGRTFTCHRTTNIAILPLGYADGINRLLSNRGEVLIRGYRAPIIGRVCMNLCMIDVTDVPGVKPGEEVVILGRQGQDCISADEMANKLGTISYEVITNLPMHIPRFYLGRRPDALVALDSEDKRWGDTY
ncbi:alanine racemase [bacterium]|nr:alanine racemase [bacterium]